MPDCRPLRSGVHVQAAQLSDDGLTGSPPLPHRLRRASGDALARSGTARRARRNAAGAFFRRGRWYHVDLGLRLGSAVAVSQNEFYRRHRHPRVLVSRKPSACFKALGQRARALIFKSHTIAFAGIWPAGLPPGLPDVPFGNGRPSPPLSNGPLMITSPMHSGRSRRLPSWPACRRGAVRRAWLQVPALCRPRSGDACRARRPSSDGTHGELFSVLGKDLT
jgi:hypothetical protein